MHKWQIITAVVTAAVAALFLAGLVVYMFSCGRRSNRRPARRRIGVLSDSQSHILNSNNNNNNNNRVHSQYSFSAEAFRWDHHPSLVAEILDHGWTAFAFTYNYFNTNSPRPWGLCKGLQAEPEITWEAVTGSNLMQKIRLNPGSASSEVMSLHAALPLPGPALGSLGFPQESYFEITIVSEGSADGEAENISFEDDDDRVNLLQLVNSDLGECSGSGADEGLRLSEVGGNNEGVSGEKKKKKRRRIIAVGQGTAPGSCACTMPGFEPGSVGFYSTGAVLLNGQQLRDEDEVLCTWRAARSIIGCGFNPNTRCIFFTINGTWVRTVMCKTVDFGSPLYPTISANYDVTILVNFGQQSFCYDDANLGRVFNPSSLNCLEDSREFFSIDRIDPLWFAEKMGWQGKNVGEVEESDLFEIVLDIDNITPL
ncbi:hypothetical protein KI387_012175 [Taxus chinensis]|uniref:SPRY domain-containing protein n=1 Tax=Taxus chinensis TaxID=29808 RepID=A0AA38CNH7_TAXCH|nr:hypothetical protein KI387_012175 [Taxus chinensis]